MTANIENVQFEVENVQFEESFVVWSIRDDNASSLLLSMYNNTTKTPLWQQVPIALLFPVITMTMIIMIMIIIMTMIILMYNNTTTKLSDNKCYNRIKSSCDQGYDDQWQWSKMMTIKVNMIIIAAETHMINDDIIEDIMPMVDDDNDYDNNHDWRDDKDVRFWQYIDGAFYAKAIFPITRICMNGEQYFPHLWHSAELYSSDLANTFVNSFIL